MVLSFKVAFNTIIQVITKVISTLLSLAALALVTRYLGKHGFGYYTTAFTFVTFFSIAADFGLTLVTTQLISRPGADQNKLLSNLFTFRIVSALAILVLAPLVGWFLPYNEVVKQGILISSLALFFVLLNQIFTSLFQKELKAEKMAYAEIISRTVMFIISATAVLLDWGLNGILWSIVIANGLSFILHYYYSRPYAKIVFLYDKKIWQEILKLSWPFMITIVLNLVYLKTDVLLLSLLRDPAEVGLYGAAYRVVDVLVTIPFMIGGTVLPILTRRWHNHQLDDYKRAWKKIFDATSLLTWPLVAGGFILATPIMILVGGEEFLSSGLILKILIFAVGGIFFSALFSYTMISFGQQRRLIKPYVFVAVSSLFLYLVFIPRYSYYAAALITLYSEIAMGLVIWWLVRRTINLKINLSIFFKALVASIIMALAVYYLPFDNLTVWGISLTVSSGVVIYVLALWILRAINLSAIKSLSNWRN